MTIPTIALMQSAIKNRMEKIPINRVIDLVYSPVRGECNGTRCQALVASSDYTKQEEGRRVYVHASSEHGILQLFRIENEPMSGWPEMINSGSYDKDPETRKITAIYLDGGEVIPAAYSGTLEHLLNNPNMRRT